MPYPLGGYGESTYGGGGYNTPYGPGVSPYGTSPFGFPKPPWEGGANFGPLYPGTETMGGGGGSIWGDIWSGVGDVGGWIWDNLLGPGIGWITGSGGGENMIGDLLGGAGMAALALMAMDASGEAGDKREELLQMALGNAEKETQQGEKNVTMGNIAVPQGLEAMLTAVQQGPQMFAPPNLRDAANPYAAKFQTATPPPLQAGPTGWIADLIGAIQPPDFTGGGDGAPTPPLSGPIIPQPDVPQPSGSGDPWPTPIPVQPNDPRRQPIPAGTTPAQTPLAPTPVPWTDPSVPAIPWTPTPTSSSGGSSWLDRMWAGLAPRMAEAQDRAARMGG